jgi:tetratricopeptide (TPR) repeat protein
VLFDLGGLVLLAVHAGQYQVGLGIGGVDAQGLLGHAGGIGQAVVGGVHLSLGQHVARLGGIGRNEGLAFLQGQRQVVLPQVYLLFLKGNLVEIAKLRLRFFEGRQGLGQLVLRQVQISELKQVAARVGHLAHQAGVGVGGSFVLLLAGLGLGQQQVVVGVFGVELHGGLGKAGGVAQVAAQQVSFGQLVVDGRIVGHQGVGLEQALQGLGVVFENNVLHAVSVERLAHLALLAGERRARGGLPGLAGEAGRQQNQPTEVEKHLRLAFDSPALDIDQAVRILVNYLKQLPDPKIAPLALDLSAAAVRNHPREAKAYSVAGDVQMQSGRKKEARNTYLQALRYDKSKYQLWQQVVLLDAELSQTDSLLVHSDAALELFPNQAPLWFYNGVGHLLKKQPQRAVQALEHGRRLAAGNPDQQSQFDSQLGDAYQELKDYAKSAAAYDAALAVDPNNYGVLNNYSYYLSLRGENLDKAKEMAGRTVQKFPDNDTYLDTYAWVLYKQKDYAGAKQNLEKALKTTKDASILEHYGDVLWQLGDHTGAVAGGIGGQRSGRGSKLRNHHSVQVT